MEKLTQLIYVSSAKEEFSEQALNDLLVVARDANKKFNITGLLLYKNGNFMQVIEGNKRDIKQLFANISRDKSHRNVTLILTEDIKQREFSDWSMGFINLSSAKVAGFSEYLSPEATTSLMPGKAKAVLLSFKYT